MTDEVYSYIQDCKDKKFTARSARHARTHRGKRGSVKFPSDYLTNKERKAMSGECKTYRLNDPISWEEFKEMPEDIKVQYIIGIRERFGCTDKAIAGMFGISQYTLSLYLTELKCSAGKAAGNANRKWDKEAFYAWTSGADTRLVEPLEAVEAEKVEQAESKVGESVAPVRAVPATGAMAFDCPADEALETLRFLLNNRHVKLSVKWDLVVED